MYVNFLYQLFVSYLNTILIYRVGILVFSKARVAEIAAYFYIFNHSMVYQMSFYSENTFLFFSLLGMVFIYSGPGSKTYGRRSWKVPTAASVLCAAFCWGMCTFARSTGVVHSLFIAYFMINKIILEARSFCKLFVYIMLCWFTILIMFVPIWTVMYWRPYLTHCETRMDRTNQVPLWCLEAMPNVYPYIQDVYWDNGFLAFLERPLDRLVTSLPMNFVLFYIVYRVMAEQPASMLSLSLRSSNVLHTQKQASLFSQPEIVPHCYYFFIQLIVVLLYGNAEINSRVASSLPVYYWAVASMLVEGGGKAKQMTWPARVAAGHNVLFLVLNLLLFPAETGFF